LAWEHEADCNTLFRRWILDQKFADESTLKEIDDEAVLQARKYQKDAFAAYMNSIDSDKKGFLRIAKNLYDSTNEPGLLEPILEELSSKAELDNRNIQRAKLAIGPATKEVSEYPILSKLALPDERCSITNQETAKYFSTSSIPIIRLNNVKPWEYWSKLPLTYPLPKKGELTSPNILRLVSKVMKYLTLYPNIISFIIDTSVSRDAGVLKTLFNLAFLVGCSGSSAKKLDLSSSKNYGQIDNYLSQNKTVGIVGCQHVHIITKLPDGSYSFFDPTGGEGSYCDLSTKLKQFVGTDKTITYSTCRLQDTRNTCALWGLLKVLLPDKTPKDIEIMIQGVKRRTIDADPRIKSEVGVDINDRDPKEKLTSELLPNDLILISIMEDFVTGSTRELDKLPPEIKEKVRTAFGGKTRKRSKGIRKSRKHYRRI
jgi:hypothetical protein